jgi:hypothetical protein
MVSHAMTINQSYRNSLSRFTAKIEPDAVERREMAGDTWVQGTRLNNAGDRRKVRSICTVHSNNVKVEDALTGRLIYPTSGRSAKH